jgi:regulator of replication initiation timing
LAQDNGMLVQEINDMRVHFHSLMNENHELKRQVEYLVSHVSDTDLAELQNDAE